MEALDVPSARYFEKLRAEKPTQLVEHVRHVFSIDGAIAVAIKELKRFPHRACLRGLQLRQRTSMSHHTTGDYRPRSAALLGKVCFRGIFWR